ncbi:hypothetical protein CNMCM5793_007726 [Aspergillus hiratsukae]|uniref:Uncharacterized protein n=1 Tax=Aspergillus hiratsukae TaxID=1194566 RepID=A0A8H6P122_9EURO|nr:hypothetical protein CNMCM5793_007726 [Aspergillus hiratsukae]KAF7159028.1 hypothetical protein CNMCM6106_006121 [Aspergillus hiratsukae]
MRYMEQILDIAGALGHRDHTHAAGLTEPIYQSYRIIYEIAVKVIDGTMGQREAYDANLVRKTLLLVSQNGWGEKGIALDVHSPDNRALMRLLCICNATTAGGGETADLVWETFYGEISDETGDLLVEGLNVEGSAYRPAVQVTYSPSVCSAAIKASKGGGTDGQKKALAAVFRYLARVLTITPADVEGLSGAVTVVERDIREKVMGVITSESFQKNPDVLDEVDVPEIEIAAWTDL